MRIARYADLAADERDALAPQVARVFFETAGTRAFPDEASRLAYRDRWLDRYLRRFPGHAFLALSGGGEAIGYALCCPDSAAAAELFADIGYYRLFMAHYAAYPAHIHVNVAAGARGRGVGSALVATVAEQARADGIEGVHAVTLAGSRAAGFYERQGMRLVAALDWEGRQLAMLGRALWG